jgi:hypothetical protein
MQTTRSAWLRALIPDFTLVEYLFVIGAILVFPVHAVVILVVVAVAAKVLLQLAISALPPVYRRWFESHSENTHESD